MSTEKPEFIACTCLNFPESLLKCMNEKSKEGYVPHKDVIVMTYNKVYQIMRLDKKKETEIQSNKIPFDNCNYDNDD